MKNAKSQGAVAPARHMIVIIFCDTCAEVSTVMVMVNNRIDLKPSLRLDLARISCDALLYILYMSDIISYHIVDSMMSHRLA